MVRNAGKFGKPKRGGGKMFSRDLKPLSDNEGQGSGSSEEESEASDGSEDSEPENTRMNNPNHGSNILPQTSSSKPLQNESGSSMTTAEARAARKAAKKGGKGAKKDGSGDEEESDGLEELANSNRTQKKTVKVAEIDKVASGPMNRKEREAAEKKAAQERYWKLHQAGKTDEAKVDLARLAKIREQREHAAAVRKAEAEAKEKEAAEKAAARKKR
ncbi:casein kinase substrate phosphoprotein PP28-domain-containing protein [Melampsora americana]|nr:casein kinase substrate phosphoprotein PP28-domain-containing protein [Melampsora americana]